MLASGGGVISRVPNVKHNTEFLCTDFRGRYIGGRLLHLRLILFDTVLSPYFIWQRKFVASLSSLLQRRSHAVDGLGYVQAMSEPVVCPTE